MRAPYKKSTVSDVAARAGVTQSTVSHYINGRANICSSETASRIDRAIADLHFTPARAMRHQGRIATNTIGVCVSVLLDDDPSTRSTYLQRFWEGVLGVVDERSYRVTHYPKAMRDGPSCDPFLDGSIDGLLISVAAGDNRPAKLVDAGLPTVCLVQSSNLPTGCGSVVANERDVIHLAMSHLWELGHRRIGYLGPNAGEGAHFGQQGEPTSETAIKRYHFWRDWMGRKDSYSVELAVFTDSFVMPPAEVAVQIADHFLSLPLRPSAIMCASDQIAMSLMDAFAERGVGVPRDISVVGIDNDTIGESHDPPLTSVEVPVDTIGKRSTEMLIDMITGAGQVEHIEIPVSRLVVRNSTCPPSSRNR